MAFEYLQESSLLETYTRAKQYVRFLDDPFQEWERIARNRPHPSIDKAYPKVTDGTTASIVQKTPRRIIQQIPTGKVHADKVDWLTIVAGFIFTNRIIPHANSQYNLIQKCWSVVEKGLIYGSQSVHVPFVNKDGNFTTDMTVPYVKNVIYEPGKVSDTDSNYILMEAYYQPKDIEAIIDRERKLKKSDKKYESTWDLVSLNKIKNDTSNKADEELTPSERKRQGGNSGGVKIVHMFQRGVGATFYSLHPKSDVIVRRKKSKDPRGEMPISTFYAGIDGSNPRGRGFVELVGAMQNLMDSEMQMFQFERALMLAPPTIKRGTWNKNQAKLIPNILVDLGSDPAASWEVLQRDTTALNNFANNYGLMKSQLLNLLSSPDTSVSSDVGNPNFSKTPQGVAALQQSMSVDDNYIRKQFEAFYERWAETAINLYFAERSGKEQIQLDEATAQKIKDLPDFDPEQMGDDNTIRIDWDTETPILKFKVDASTSKIQDDADQLAKQQNLLEMVMKYPMLNSSFGGPIDVDMLSRKIVNVSGVEDPEEVAPEPTPAQKEAKAQAKNSPNPFSPMFDKPSIRMNFPDLPPVAQVALLQSAGVPNITIQDVLQGPVVDPNIRGTTNPVNAPGELLPGQQPGQPPQSMPQPGTVPTANGSSVDAADLVKLYQLVPEANKPAILNMITGLQQVGVTQPTQDANLKAIGQAHSDASSHAQDLAPPEPTIPPGSPPQGQTNQASDAESPQEDASETPQQEQAEQQPQFSPEDQQLIQQLQAAGIPEEDIGKAIAMLHAGYNDQQILQMLTQGATT